MLQLSIEFLFQEQLRLCVSAFRKCTICCKCAAFSPWSVVCWEDDNCNIHGLISYPSSFTVFYWWCIWPLTQQFIFLFLHVSTATTKLRGQVPEQQINSPRKHCSGEYTIQLYYEYFSGSSISSPHSSHLPEFWLVEIVFQWVDSGHWYVARNVVIAVRQATKHREWLW